MKDSYIAADFRATVDEQFKSRASELNTAFDSRLKRLRAENADASPEMRKYLENQIMPGIAAYETLQTVMPKQEALGIVHSYVENRALKIRGMIDRIMRIPGLYRLVPGIAVKGTHKMFGDKAGFSANEIKTDGRVWRINMTKCPYHDACLRYGCPELCPCFCDSDDVTYDNMHPKLEWRRTKTLGRGDDCCDFCLKIRNVKI